MKRPPARRRTAKSLPDKRSGQDGKEPIPVLSFFSGAGGMDYGFHLAGFVSVLAIDRDMFANETFNANFPSNVAVSADLATFDAQRILALLPADAPTPRGIVGGPPCQGFSVGNTRAKRNDPRNQLALRYSELVTKINESLNIDFFVFENVVGLTSAKHRARLARIKAQFHEGGFNVFQHELDATSFGVPQRRRRLFLVGINRKKFLILSLDFLKRPTLGKRFATQFSAYPNQCFVKLE